MSQLERSAYHESGHILITYFAGYSCEAVVLNADTEGNSFTKQNYGEDLLIITAVTNYRSNPEIFEGLTNDFKNKTLGISSKASNILVAGSIAEAIYVSNFNLEEDLELEISGPDLLRVDQINYFLTKKLKEHSDNYIQKIMIDVLGLLKLEEFIKPLKELANALIKAPKYTLNQSAIEKILKDTGFLKTIEPYL